MKSCQTRTPSSSQRSWKVSDSYAPVPGILTTFIPAARSCSSATRSSSSPAARLTKSGGVQTTPRAKMSTPFTRRASGVSSTAYPGPGSSSRKPTRRESSSAPARSVNSCRVGSPCVCGHHSSTFGTRTSPSTLPSTTGTDARQPASSSSSSSGSAPSIARSWAVTRSTPSPSSSRGRSSNRSRTIPRRRSRKTGFHGPTGAGPGAKPGQRPSSIVRKKRRFPGASCVRQRDRGLRDPSRSGASAWQWIRSSFSLRSSDPTSRSRATNIDSLWTTCSPLRYTSATVAIPSSRSTTSSPSPAGAAPKRVRNQQSRLSRSTASVSKPPSRRAPAAVPGTRAGSHSPGSPPGSPTASCQPSSRGAIATPASRGASACKNVEQRL